MTTLVLEEYRHYFKDEKAFSDFIKELSSRVSEDLTPVMHNEQVLGAVLSAEAAKDVLYERMVKRMAKTPGILDEIKDRIENDEIVDP